MQNKKKIAKSFLFTGKAMTLREQSDSERGKKVCLRAYLVFVKMCCGRKKEVCFSPG